MSVKELNTIEDVASQIKINLDKTNKKKKNVFLLYAFNATGKTRLSNLVSDIQDTGTESEKVLVYSAFFEDLFFWDNENCTLNFNQEDRIINFIKDEGLENHITDNFQKITRSKINPLYDFVNGKIIFNFSPGDERNEENIKISRGEESLFIWSVFQTVLESVIFVLNTDMESRGTDIFDGLEYIIIDDPVSSIDDINIIAIAVELIQMINSSEKEKPSFFITTHHPLFYNVLYNEFRKQNKKCLLSPYLLSKKQDGFELREQKDTPFGYHLIIKDKIQEAIDNESLEKYHFNLFRGLLEKTANFLGYSNWDDCLDGDNKKEIIKLVNLYSHGKLSELESKHFPDKEKEVFIESFNKFILKFKWNTK